MSDYLEEKWLETGIDNDFMFHCVMSKHPELCLELLQMIFPELGITNVTITETQKEYEESPNLKKFLKMVSEHEATDDFTRKIQEIIDYFHMDDETRDSYMTLEMKKIEETKYARKIALEEGLELGKKQGLEQGKLLEIISCVKDGLFSEEVGAKRAGLPLEEFRKRLANLHEHQHENW